MSEEFDSLYEEDGNSNSSTSERIVCRKPLANHRACGKEYEHLGHLIRHLENPKSHKPKGA